MRDLDRHRVPVDGDVGPAAVQRPALDGCLADADRAGEPQDLVAEGRRLVRAAEDGERVGRSALLHEDRRQPRVGGAGVHQGGQHRRPYTRVHVVDVGLEDAPSTVRRPVPLPRPRAEHDANDVGSSGRVARARPDPGGDDVQRGQGTLGRREGRHEGCAGRCRQLTVAARLHLPPVDQPEHRGNRHRQQPVNGANRP